MPFLRLDLTSFWRSAMSLFLSLFLSGILSSECSNMAPFVSFRSHFHLGAVLFFTLVWTELGRGWTRRVLMADVWLGYWPKYFCSFQQLQSNCFVHPYRKLHRVKWAEVLQIGSIHSLPAFPLKYANSSPSEKTQPWLGGQFTLKVPHYRKNRQDFDKLGHWTILTRFSLSNTWNAFISCPRTCNNFLCMWHTASVLVGRIVDLTIF